MEDYYRKYASKYEAVYRRDNPELKSDLSTLSEIITRIFKGKTVLEIAS